MQEDPDLQTAPLSLHHTIASHYLTDARDFAERFDILWERQLHKTGRIKSFIDLLMAVECALKAHAIMGRRNENIDDVYREARRRGHDIETLCAYTTYLNDRTLYETLSGRLGPFSVFARYSLDAYETFFPSLMERDQAPIDHRRTIGNNAWVLDTRALVDRLLEAIRGEFYGFVTDSLEELIAHEEQMKAFADRHIRR